MSTDDQHLIDGLDSFDTAERAAALEQLIAAERPDTADTGNVNMHFHSFFSYNAQGWSPSHIAWAARRAGLYAAALCDFDVLDGLEEFLKAGQQLGLRTAVHLETRVFLEAMADREITSPGEPGVTYIMAAAFPRVPAAGTRELEELEGYRSGALRRNHGLVNRINAQLGRIAVDCGRDVKPMVPAGTATERHIISAYIRKAVEVCGPEGAVSFWAGVTRRPETEIAAMSGTPALDELVRGALAKRGGIGYVQPSKDTFPPAREFIDWAGRCGALPMITWLDGTSAGERDPVELFECQAAMGTCCLNIIPDRNWNVKKPEERARKTANLKAAVAAAEAMDMPINIGTEMNRAGLPFCDDLTGPELARYAEVFRRGARVMVGHTLLARYADYGYTGEQAAADFPKKNDRNTFFAKVGGLPPLDATTAQRLRDMGTVKALAWFREKAQ